MSRWGLKDGCELDVAAYVRPCQEPPVSLLCLTCVCGRQFYYKRDLARSGSASERCIFGRLEMGPPYFYRA